MPPFRRLLVALSGHSSDAGLLDYAAMLGRLLPAADALAVHVTDTGAQRLDVTRQVASRLPGTTCELLSGDVLDSILDLASSRGCDLILLGHKLQARRRRSLARRLAMKAPCSVWMVPDGSRATIERVLVPVDFSPRSADSLGVATSLCEAAGLDECLALHVYFNDAAVTFDEFEEILVENAGQAFGIFTAPVDLRGVFARPVFVEASNVAQTILRVASEQESDLIVMGTRGRSASATVLLGSETEQALMRATVPVLAVKHFGARMRLFQALRDQRAHRESEERYT